MSEYSNYMWSVPDWRTDEMYTMLDNREQGIYRNLIDECWVAGTVTSDLESLARFSREPLDYFLKVWTKIRIKFRPIGDGQRLISTRLEQDRRRLMLNAKFNEKRAKKAAKVRWAKERAEKELNATSMFVASSEHAFEQCQIHSQSHSPLIPLLKDSPNTVTSVVPVVLPPTEKRGGRTDPAAELFKAAYQGHIGNPYEWLAGDFPQIAKLRKRLKLESDQTPADWETGLENYFASPFAEFSLQHFAAKFDTFKNSQLDRFHVPTNHKGNGNGPEKESYGERVARKNRETAAQFDHELFGTDGNGAGSGSAERTSPALLPRTKQSD